jgi:hypothetical protein
MGDFAEIYDLGPLIIFNLKGLILGTGVNVAIIGQSDVHWNDDIQDFVNSFGAGTELNYNDILAGSCQDPGYSPNDEDEADMDIEWSFAIARGATFNFVKCDTVVNQGVISSLTYAVDQNLGTVISMSYGDCEANRGASWEDTFYEPLIQQASSQGQTVLVSSGDSGAAGCDAKTESEASGGLAVNAFASSPEVTAVGGTELNEGSGTYWDSSGSAVGYIPELAWNDSAAGTGLSTGLDSTGGGASTMFVKPWWQYAFPRVGMPIDDGARDLPDVALSASAAHDGYFVCAAVYSQSGVYQGYSSCDTSGIARAGGTSVATPAFAGIVALINQSWGGAQGSINSDLYYIAGRTTDFHDIEAGPYSTEYELPNASSNIVPCSGGYGCSGGFMGFRTPTGNGYNQATGLGSVDGYKLYNDWVTAGILHYASTTSVTVTPNSVPQGSTNDIVIRATVTQGSGPAPPGMVYFSVGMNLVQGGETSNGTVGAGIDPSTLPVGTYTITAVYTGGPSTTIPGTTNGSSGTATLTVTALPTPTVTVTPSSSSVTTAQALNVTVAVGGGSGNPTPTGTVTLTSGSYSSGAQTLASGSYTFTVPPNSLSVGTDTLTASYSGDTNYAAESGTATVTVTAATAPVASVSPASLTFSNQPVGTTSASQPVTLSNTGNAALTITSIGTNTNFGQTNNCGTSVAASGSCTINVTFTPTATGPLTGTLTITDNSNGVAGSTQTVNLTGTGTPTAPVAAVSPASLTFSNQPVGTTSASQPVTLSNTGNAALTITSIGTNTNFGQTNNCGTSVAASGSCTINVTFTPTATGPLTGTLTTTDNSNGVAGSTQRVALSGTGQDFSFAAASGSPTSATVAPGSTATYTLSITGEGGFNQSVSFTCTGAPSKATCAVSPNPVTAGSSATNVTVSVTTTAPSLSVPRSRPLPPAPPLSPGLRGLLMLALVLALMAWAIERRKQLGVSRRRSALVPLAAGLLLTLALAGCGGGGSSAVTPPSNPGTPAGTYTLTVTGSTGSGSSAFSHSVTLTLTVS